MADLIHTPPRPPIDWKGLFSFWQSFKDAIHTSLTNNKTINAMLIVSQFFLSAAYKASGPVALALAATGTTLSIQGCIQPNPPEPPPVPPDPPGPTPVPAPIAGEGFRVLFLKNKETETQLPEAQRSIFSSKTLIDYLNTKCILGPDGKTKEWRVYPTSIDTKSIHKKWADAMARPRSGDFWMIVSNGKTGWEGPLPKNVDEAMVIFKKFEPK